MNRPEKAVVELGKKKYLMKQKENSDEITLSEINAKGEENGLFVRRYEDFWNNILYEIGKKKSGKIDGATYVFIGEDATYERGYMGYKKGGDKYKLYRVKIGDKTVDSSDVAFKTYQKTAPKFNPAKKLFLNAERIMRDNINKLVAKYEWLNHGLFQ